MKKLYEVVVDMPKTLKPEHIKLALIGMMIKVVSVREVKPLTPKDRS